jgi:cell division protein FtsB
MAARAQARRTAAKPRRRPARRKPAARRGASRVNWDRVGRIALTLVLAAVLYSYLNPAIDFVKTYTATTAAKAKQHELQAENTRLHNRVQSADDPVVIDRLARAQGMVAEGETPIVIHGIGG